MSFTTFFPCDELKSFVKSFAISESEGRAAYKVLPDTGIVMGFQYSGNLSYTTENKTVPLSAAGITGLNDTYRVFHNAAYTNTLLVRFSETGAAAFFRQPMHELFSLSQSLDDLVLRSQMDVVTEQINESKTDAERISKVEAFLLSLLHHKAHDELVSLAVTLIKQQGGNIKMAALAQQLHISQGQFEKRFRRIVGASPKKFASIVRLRSLLDNPLKENSMTRTGMDAGYYDQAHFIKDFKAFTGETPEEYFGKK